MVRLHREAKLSKVPGCTLHSWRKSVLSDNLRIHRERWSASTRAAFTLVELLVVIAIIGILSWVALASRASCARSRAENVVQQQHQEYWSCSAQLS